MRHLSVYVYRHKAWGDCTNDGVSSRHNTMTLFWECKREEAIAYCEENGMDTDACLWLNVRYFWGEDHSAAEPLVKPHGMCGPMMGGNFVYSCDSRLYKQNGQKCGYPIPVHDRFETQDEYESFSD